MVDQKAKSTQARFSHLRLAKSVSAVRVLGISYKYRMEILDQGAIFQLAESDVQESELKVLLKRLFLMEQSYQGHACPI
jgi:hypothetical protein